MSENLQERQARLALILGLCVKIYETTFQGDNQILDLLPAGERLQRGNGAFVSTKFPAGNARRGVGDVS